VRLCILLFLLCGCIQNNKLKPSDTKLNISNRNWEELYARELFNALKNEDDLAFYFFWPYYLEARYENKLKKLDKQ
jgi:hypothetical protein